MKKNTRPNLFSLPFEKSTSDLTSSKCSLSIVYIPLLYLECEQANIAATIQHPTPPILPPFLFWGAFILNIIILCVQFWSGILQG